MKRSLHQLTTALLIGLLGISLLSACGKKAGGGAASVIAEAAAPVARREADPRDPCRLLEPKEAETLLGAPLAGPPFRAESANRSDGGTPRADGDTCWYETADFHNVAVRSEEHTSELQSLMRISYAVFC